MTISRFEVPLTPSSPDFEDESTIATARQVVPIRRARSIEFWRSVRTLLPLLLAATLCGALGAAAVNYFERKESPQVLTVQQPPANIPVLVKTEPSPVAIIASADMNGAKTAEVGALAPQDSSVKNGQQADKTENQPGRSDDKRLENEVRSPEHKNSDVDAAKLTRKRRVHAADEEAPSANKNGAGRIVDIFGNPNP